MGRNYWVWALLERRRVRDRRVCECGALGSFGLWVQTQGNADRRREGRGKEGMVWVLGALQQVEVWLNNSANFKGRP